MACFAFPTAPRCSRRYVPTYRHLRRDAVGGASGRSWWCVATQLVVRRHAVLGASGAQLLAMWVSWRIEGKAKM